MITVIGSKYPLGGGYPSGFVYDTFTTPSASNQSIQTHSPEVGGSYSPMNSGANVIASSGKFVAAGSSDDNGAINMAAPPSANYTASARFNGFDDNFAQLYVRWTLSGTTRQSGYFFFLRNTAMVSLAKIVNGAYSGIGDYSGSWVEGDTLGLGANGSRISFYVNGVEQYFVTDTSVTQVGYAGLGGAPGATWDNFRAYTP